MQGRLGADFHAITLTEYTVALPGAWQRERHAGLAARLSHQSASWSGRTCCLAAPSRPQHGREAAQYIAAAEDGGLEQGDGTTDGS
ncbi:RNaseH domain-containing protein [Streptomyces chartreusis]|uniref:RNaseH domain-containing protein n=1 Tax=Streptomyces chartreusis TaxID=1969 RepID=UPI003D8AB61B